MSEQAAPEIVVVDDLEGVQREGASRFARAASRAVADRGRFAVVLAGGSTPRGMYQALRAAELPWDHTDVFFGDERGVPPDDPASNYGMAWEALLAHVPLPPGRIHRMPAEAVDADAAARAYEAELHAALGRTPRFDLVLLGLGPEGHTASLFPGAPAVAERQRLVVAYLVDRAHGRRMTLTPPALAAAEQVLFLAAGPEKAEAVAAVVAGPSDPSRYPAQAVRPRPPDRLAFVLDRPAAARLPRPAPGGAG